MLCLQSELLLLRRFHRSLFWLQENPSTTIAFTVCPSNGPNPQSAITSVASCNTRSIRRSGLSLPYLSIDSRYGIRTNGALDVLSCIHHIFQIQVAILLLQLRIRPPGKQMPSPYPADKTLPENGLLLHPHHGSMVHLEITVKPGCH